MSYNDSSFNKDDAILMNSTEGRVQLVIQFLVAWSFHDSLQKTEARNN